jgi:hypothetical protein
VLNSGSYANLVNRPATRSAGTLVIPSDAVNSVLFKRITGDLSPLLLQMPLGGPFLSTAELTLIKNWIIEGALNN